ncbi:MAG: CCA tRNA nucleotidyltransferase [Deltaproteobacteria bacterium]|nr:CCA tRNA nucleotidyltransferase [Deltaproteobacteria bacterium]
MFKDNIYKQIPDNVISICEILEQNGESGWVVGGSIRDLIMDKDPKDFDLATSATPQKVISLFKRVIPTGLKHGTVTVLIKNDAYEITTFRQDGDYLDSRHPENVQFVTDINDDLSRRDFTINAIAYNPVKNIFADPFDGVTDIKNRIIKAVGNAEARFNEDALRILRCARFSASLGFEVEADTIKGILTTNEGLKNISVERIREEFIKLLLSDSPALGLDILFKTGSLKYISPPVNNLFTGKDGESYYKITVKRVEKSPKNITAKMVAALIDTDNYIEWIENFTLDNKTKKEIIHLLTLLPLKISTSMSNYDLRILASKITKSAIEIFLEIAKADEIAKTGSDKNVSFLEAEFKKLKIYDTPLSVKELNINGDQIITALKIKPGVHMKIILNTLLDEVMNNPQLNKTDELIKLSEKIYMEATSSRVIK